MRDLEIKGTGNSRYIKSSVPASTTFDEFLTMLRAGNLPIDLMGLNTAGIITQSPSAYNKANVLPEDVCELMSLDATASEPDDAFRYLALMQASVYGKVVVTVTSNGLPLSGVTFTLGSSTLTTDAEGKASAILAPGGYTVKFTNTLDLSFSPSSFAVTSTKGKINYYTAQATELSNNQKTFTSSQTFQFSKRVKSFDVFCVGGGGSGAAIAAASDAYILAAGASGGAGGYTNTTLNQAYDSSKSITVTIGAGGAGVSVTNTKTITTSGYEVTASSNGNDGGTTQVSYGGSVICTANGGEGGNYGSSNGRSGGSARAAKGGNGSAFVPMFREQTGSSDYGNYYAETSYCGNNGEDPYYYTSVTDYPQSDPREKHILTGYSQGTNTRAFGESSGTKYSTPGDGVYVCYGAGSIRGSTYGTANEGDYDYGSGLRSGSVTSPDAPTNGDGSGGAVIHGHTYSSSTAVNLKATSGDGGKGLVIIRWRYN